ncbi:MAG: hypothetical protein AAF390_06085 [Pseudomonadota bacterium]
MAQMATAAPARKVMASSGAVAVATILVWIFETYVLEQPFPEAVKAAVLTICVFAVGYLVPPAPTDRVVTAAGAG